MRNRLLIKVCGMRDASNIRAVEALGIDWMGFIFWPGSSRYVAQRPAYLPTKARRVGVFVDADIADLMALLKEYALDIIQLHGRESPDYLRRLRRSIITSAATETADGGSPAINAPAAPETTDGGFPAIIKAFSIATAADLRQTAAYEDLADCFLFDTKSPLVGGSGRQFDWSILSAYDGPTPFLLSGGIGPDDANRLQAFHHPRCVGIDLNSRFELAPGLKDAETLKTFITKIKGKQL
jgi:phosphoribosylanthranilate isomerase